jgi:ABC-type phosphate transport system substrate-binding protein
MAVLGAVFLVAVASLSATGNRARAADNPPDTVTLRGEGSWDPMGEMTTWQNDLYGTGQTGLINMDYLANGGYTGRLDYLAGSLDYVLSGVPFTSDELKQLPGGAGDLIDAPVQVAAMGVLMNPPINDALPGMFAVIRQHNDANQTVDYIPYTGPARVPSPNLAAMLLHFAGTQQNVWDAPAVISAFGITLECPSPSNDLLACDTFTPTAPEDQPQPVLRSEPSEADYYVQLFAQTAANQMWTTMQQQLKRSFEPISERLPVLTAQTRPGVEQQVNYFSTPATFNQVIGPVPPYATSLPGAPKTWIQVQNANGDWVVPTPASVDAAVNAGGDTPLYALSDKVPGAYPLVYVTHLYAPAHGLSIQKTEALATTIRYLATAGQSATAAAGDGRLPAPLVLQALDAANRLVQSNCAGPGMAVTVSNDPGPYAPPSLASQHLGPMDHCAAAVPPPATTTTTTRPTTTTTRATTTTTQPTTTTTTAAPLGSSGGALAASSPGSSSGGSGSGTGGSAQAEAQAVTPAPATGPTRAPPAAGLAPAVASSHKSGAVILTALPLAPPWSAGRGWDTLSGLVIGALLYLAARRPARAFVRSFRE